MTVFELRTSGSEAATLPTEPQPLPMCSRFLGHHLKIDFIVENSKYAKLLQNHLITVINDCRAVKKCSLKSCTIRWSQVVVLIVLFPGIIWQCSKIHTKCKILQVSTSACRMKSMHRSSDISIENNSNLKNETTICAFAKFTSVANTLGTIITTLQLCSLRSQSIYKIVHNVCYFGRTYF